ncbi:hypothetical protein NOJ05_19520 [Neorhizobium galegae]|uniref:hypothetical protein n=1 Tax=Neorhizobium galegae TaxID=399 RepID=UPI002105545A|nr:hypothetical protein [Neorhizobium galegae]MCQ1779402.1 hypothetical protein [Neorhizobium galegae]MCQ1795562.1 hypothetical protein [Neorhizobium galegae]
MRAANRLKNIVNLADRPFPGLQTAYLLRQMPPKAAAAVSRGAAAFVGSGISSLVSNWQLVMDRKRIVGLGRVAPPFAIRIALVIQILTRLG